MMEVVSSVVRVSDSSVQHATQLQVGRKQEMSLVKTGWLVVAFMTDCMMMETEEMFLLRVRDKRICKGT